VVTNQEIRCSEPPTVEQLSFIHFLLCLSFECPRSLVISSKGPHPASSLETRTVAGAVVCLKSRMHDLQLLADLASSASVHAKASLRGPSLGQKSLYRSET
jgi:hypothetical protein